jgi:hypothetical protein
VRLLLQGSRVFAVGKFLNALAVFLEQLVYGDATIGGEPIQLDLVLTS